MSILSARQNGNFWLFAVNNFGNTTRLNSNNNVVASNVISMQTQNFALPKLDVGSALPQFSDNVLLLAGYQPPQRPGPQRTVGTGSR